MSQSTNQENHLIENTEIIPATAEIAKAIQEVQAQVVSAKKFPRNIGLVYDEIINACKIKSLASVAEYLLPIGGRSITGPSVRIAEVVLQFYGNCEMSTKIIEDHDNHGIYESAFIDYEKNIKKSIKYKITYTRYSRKGGHKKLEDHSDIKRAINRIAALHERDCLFKCVPKYIIDDALTQCRKTLQSSGETLPEIIKSMTQKFNSLITGKVTREDLEKRLKHPVEEMSLEEITEYGKIYNSLCEGASKKRDWFKSDIPEQSDNSNTLNNSASNKVEKFEDIENELKETTQSET